MYDSDIVRVHIFVFSYKEFDDQKYRRYGKSSTKRASKHETKELAF